MRNRNSVWRLVVLAAVLAGLAACGVSPARAVIIAGGDGSGNTTATYPTDAPFPGSDPGWGSVGLIGSDTCVYLGNGWVITAYHVTYGALPSSVFLGGTLYTQFSGDIRRLYEPGNPSQPSDLELIRLDPSHPLPTAPSFTLSTHTPSLNSWVAGIGDGPQNRSATIDYWDSSGGTLAGSAGSTYSGYTYPGNAPGALHAMRWGEGQVAHAAGQPPATVVEAVDDGAGVSLAFHTTFANLNNSMQNAYGDSGGGVFSYSSGKWQLSGIMIADNNRSAVPGDVAVFGYTDTYIADLNTATGYGGQIALIVPEPSSVALLAGGGAALLVCRLLRARRRRSAEQ